MLGANRNTSALPVLLARGKGDGTFNAPLAFAHDTFSWAVAAGDFNGDGLADAVATTDNGRTVSVYLGHSATGLASHVRYGNYLVPAPPAIADFTGDGILDLALAANPLLLLKGRGDGTFIAGQLAIVFNNSSTNVSVGPVTVQGPDSGSFSAAQQCSTTVPPAGVCRIAVNFSPTTAGAKSASLEIMTSDGPLSVALSGNGTIPPPVAVADSYSVLEDSVLNVPPPSVRANDSNAGSAALSAVLIDSPSHGLLTLNPDGSFVYTPAANFNGSDGFTYQLSDGTTDANVAAVSLTVSSINDVPIASDGSLTVDEDTTGSGTLTASDVDNTGLDICTGSRQWQQGHGDDYQCCDWRLHLFAECQRNRQRKNIYVQGQRRRGRSRTSPR